MEDRAALILAVTHDLEKRIRKGRLYEIDDMLNRCQTPVFQKKAAEKWRLFRGQESKAKHEMHALFRRMYRLEVLDPKWTAFLKKQSISCMKNFRQKLTDRSVLSFVSL